MNLSDIPKELRPQVWRELCRQGAYYRDMANFFRSVVSDKDKERLDFQLIALKKLLRHRDAYAGSSLDLAMVHMDNRIAEVKDYANRHPMLTKRWEDISNQYKLTGHT